MFDYYSMGEVQKLFMLFYKRFVHLYVKKQKTKQLSKFAQSLMPTR